MKTTFQALGIPFPLYEAPVKPTDDSDYVGRGTCCICGRSNDPCFRLGIPSKLLVPCPGCGAVNGLAVYDHAPGDCCICGTRIVFPATVAAESEPKSCYTCLRAGKVAISKATEFGVVSWENALSGITGGVPGLKQDQFESVLVDSDGDWIGVRLSEQIITELLRTPTYGSWQGECWLFCCQYAMTFVGEWHQEQFASRDPENGGERLYYALEDIPADTWDALGQSLSVYVFECKCCSKLRAHWDSD